MGKGRLEGKVAVVTGGAKGQGAGVARAFARQGARLGLLDVLDREGERLARELEDSGAQAAYIHCDVSIEDDVKAALDATAERFGGIDVLYNNAAVLSFAGKVADLPVESFDRTVAVNLRGSFLCSKYALPYLTAGGGSIINIGSHGAFQASAVGIADYACTKGALVTLTYYLAAEYGPEGVRANCIAPGPIPTDLTDIFLGSEEGRAMAAAMIPLGRVGEIEDVARAAVFLASDDAAWISGAVLRVDGGIVVQ